MNATQNASEPVLTDFPTWERVDTGPLSWVMSELRDALERSLDSLKAFAQNPDDSTPLKLAKSNLHQAHGALQIVDLEGVSLLTEEVESLLEGFETSPQSCTPEAVEVVSSTYRAVTEYLEELLAGAPHQPVRLFPSYRALLGLRNAERIHPADLFYPDLSVRPPRSSSGNGRLLSSAEIAAQRSRFERGLLQYLRNETDLAAAKEMSEAVTVIESSPKQGQQRAFWWVTRAFFEALLANAVPADLNVKRLCARINLQIRRLLDGSGTVAERLLRDTLFFVARSAAVTPHLAEVKEVYALDHSLPDDFETERYGRINFQALRTAKEALSSAKTGWGHVVGGDGAHIAGFARDTSALLAAAGSLGRPGLVHVAQVVANLATELSFEPRKPSDATGLDVATALLFLESALEQVRSLDDAFDARADIVVARVEASALGQKAEEGSTPWLDEISRQAQERLTMASFISEMQSNLRSIEKTLDAFFRDSSQRAELPLAEKLLGQIGGALSVLGHEQAGLAIQKGRESIKRFGEEGYQPDPAEFGRVAESLGAVGFYIENLQHRADVGTVFRFDSETGLFSADLARGPAPKKQVEEEPDSDPEPSGPGGAFPPSGPDASPEESSVEQEIAIHGDMVAQLAQTLRVDPTNQIAREQLSDALHRVQQDALLVDDRSLKDRAAVALKVLHETHHESAEDLTASVFDLTNQTQRFGEAWDMTRTAPLPEVSAPVPEEGTSVDAELLEIFLSEALEVLDTARNALIQISAEPTDRDQLTELRRAFHTLKGSGRMVGLKALGEAGWAIEQTANHWLAESMAATPDLIVLLKRAINELDAWVADLSDFGYSNRSPDALCAAAAAVREGRSPDALEEVAGAPAASAVAHSIAPLTRSFIGGATEVASPLPSVEMATDDFLETEVLPPEIDEEVEASVALEAADLGFAHVEPSAAVPARLDHGSAKLPVPAPIAEELALDVSSGPAMEIATEDYMSTEVLTGQYGGSRAPASKVTEPVNRARPAGMSAAGEGEPRARKEGVRSSPLLPPMEIATEDYQRTEVMRRNMDRDDSFTTTEVLVEDLDEDPSDVSDSSLEAMDFDFLEPASSKEERVLAPSHDLHLADGAVTPEESSLQPHAASTPAAHEPKAVPQVPETAIPAFGVATVLPFSMPAPPRPEEQKQIGTLTLSVPLYNIYLSEADELLRTLTQDFGEWRHELNRRASQSAVRAAHSLSGTSATIGLNAVHDLAYAVESVLQFLHRTSWKVALEEISLLQDGVEGLRAMLHRFAADILPQPDVALGARLFALRDNLKARAWEADHQAPPAVAPEHPDVASHLSFAPPVAEIPEVAPAIVEEGAVETPAVQVSIDHVQDETAIDTDALNERAAEEVSQVVAQPLSIAPAATLEIPTPHGHFRVDEPIPNEPGAGSHSVELHGSSKALPEADLAWQLEAPEFDNDVFAANASLPATVLESAIDSLSDSAAGSMALQPEVQAPQQIQTEHPESVEASENGAVLDAAQPREGVSPVVESFVAEEVYDRALHVAKERDPVASDLPEPTLETAATSAASASEFAEPGSERDQSAFDHGRVAEATEPATNLYALSGVRDEIDPELIEIFLQEASEYLPRIGEALRGWQSDPRNLSHPQALLRQMHTVKGSARMAGAMRLGELVHHMETRVESAVNLRDIPASSFEELLAAHDHTIEIYDALMHPTAVPVPDRRSVPREEELEESALAAPVEPSEILAEPAGTALAFAANRTATGGAPATRGAQVVQAVRVRADVLDRLVNQAGEVSISRSRLDNEVGQMRSSLSDLTENLGRLRAQLREIEIQAETQMQSQLSMAKERERFDPLEFDRFTRLQELTRMMAESVNDVATVHQNMIKSLDGANRDLLSQQRMTRDLQQDLMRVRMVPFSSVAERLYRVVRQTAKELDKRVNLDIRGGGVEIDRSVLERMAAPFEHILRNAIVHGVESRAERIQMGKAETGELLLEVRQEGNEIVLVFSDDGAGLNLERIRDKGRQAGLLDAQDEVADARAADLIFHPGFTTVQEVTELAGRGIGMDVVRGEAGGLGGRVSVDTEQGRGTRFTINLPLTLAVTQVVLVTVAGRTFALPSVLVEQVQQLRPQPLAQAYNDGQIPWLGQAVKLHFLAALLGERDRSPIAQRYSPILILRSGGERIAVHVDEVIGNQEVVVKNIGPQLARMIGIAGATVLGSGDIVLIVNPVQLAQQVERERPQLALPNDAEVGGAVAELIAIPVRAEPVAGLETLPTVMVVDDSLTVRRVTQRLLTREGYQVVLAKDGVDALQQLQDYTPDVMLVDIEMPRMDGFDLTRNIRSDERYQHIPIIMITSRTADKHRSFAMELGVNVYLGKPYQESELLQHLSRFVGNQKRAIA